MPRFRKRPVQIEALQWTGPDSLVAVKLFAGDAFVCWHMADNALSIATLEGTVTASLGDWIVRGTAGEFYFCKDSIFRQTYAPVEDTNA